MATYALTPVEAQVAHTLRDHPTVWLYEQENLARAFAESYNLTGVARAQFLAAAGVGHLNK